MLQGRSLLCFLQLMTVLALSSAAVINNSSVNASLSPDPYAPISYICHDNGFTLDTRRNHSIENRNRPGVWTTKCENEVFELDCGRGKVVEILDVEYGRFDRSTCHSYPFFFMRCDAASAYHKLHQRCDNKQRCSITAANSEFGDPCPGIVKYLRVKHSCEPVGDGQLQSRTVCEGDELSVSCPTGKSLLVTEAMYGRLKEGTQLCPGGAANSTNADRAANSTTADCRSPETLDILSARCDGRQNCTLRAGNEMFGDPCPGLQKYLQMDYLCLIDDLQEAVACEGSDLLLECKNQSYISVVRAEYGRGHPYICTGGGPRKVEPAGCSSSNELAVIFNRCQGKASCTVPATNEIFGDPCPVKSKYLEVEFFCSEMLEESDSGGPPQVKSLGSDRVTIFSDKLNVNNSFGYIAQIKENGEENWFTVADPESDDELTDLGRPVTIGGLRPGLTYQARYIKKKGRISSCLPFTSLTARLN